MTIITPVLGLMARTGGEKMKLIRRLAVSLGSVVALLLAGGAAWKIG
jgi:hypothetical protein